jgi:hypothetical protein
MSTTPRLTRHLRPIAAMAVAAALAFPAAAAADFGVTPSAGALPDSSSFWAGTCDLFASDDVAFGTPASTPSAPRDCIDLGVFGTGGLDGPQNTQSVAPAWRLSPATAAGGHPDGSATFTMFPSPVDASAPDGNTRDAVVDLPAGVLANVRAVDQCSLEDQAEGPTQCPPSSQVGILSARLFTDFGVLYFYHPVYNLEARKGLTAELGVFDINGRASISIYAKARTDGDFGVATGAKFLPTAFPLVQQTLTIWGVPWAASHDRWRVHRGWRFPAADSRKGIPAGGLDCSNDGAGVPACPTSYDPSWGPIRSFFTNPTECAGQPLNTKLWLDSYEDPAEFDADGDPLAGDARWLSYDSSAPAVTACDEPPFDPAASFVPTSTGADSASGLEADIAIPQNNDPPASVASNPDDVSGAPAYWKSAAGRATAHLDRTVVRLPEGMSVNPSAAAGLVGCTDAQMGVTAVGNPYTFDNVEPSCPDGSRIGSVEATTPVLEGSPNLTGEVILGTPKSTDPASGEMFRLFLVLRNADRNVLAKVYGSSVADPQTGRLTATFDKNPRVPVENINVKIKGGSRGVLAMPQSCGQKTTVSEFTPWTAAHGGGGPVRNLSDSFTVGGDCSLGFTPRLTAGMSTQGARSTGTFGFRFSREDGEQWVDGLTAQLPAGLLASVKNVPLCSNAQAGTGACPAGSRIGTVDASAGSGSPFVLERKGSAYLTEGYKGCAYGLAVVVPVVAGPFDASSPATDLGNIVVRQAVCVDPSDAHVTAVSDPLPTVHHGIPLRVRSVTVNVDRDRFMLNPSDCQAKQVVSDFGSPQGAGSRQVSPFHVAGCAALPFRPRLSLRLTGRRQVKTGKHPGVRAQVTQAGVGEAGIEKAVVRLPRSLALDPDNAQALCEFDAGTKPDIEKHCPKGSIVGRVRATSPLLNRPLAGNVYFVKNIRIDAKTGNRIRTLPMIVAALRGEIAVNLRGESSTTKRGELVNTFASVPDAPVSQFNLNIAGGKNGILAVTRTRRSTINLCATGRQIAQVDMDGHNGRRHDRNIRIAKPCGKTKSSAKKRKRRAARN